MVRHQEARAKWPDHIHLVAHLQVAHIVRRHATHRIALVVFQHALDGQRDIVVAGPLAIARTGERILARMVRAPAGIHAGRHDADGLAFQHRERRGAEVQHDMVRIVVTPDRGDARIADHGGRDGASGGLGAVEVGIGVRRRPRRHGGAVLGAVEYVVAGDSRRQ